jgi:hypothetical protein
MNGWMWQPAEAEAINRQAPRVKGGAEPGPEWAVTPKVLIIVFNKNFA